MFIPFNKPFMTGNELKYIARAHEQRHLSGDGYYTQKCHEWMRKISGASCALLTHSCTAALEMSAILLDVGPGDEVIMPSYTFVSTANAFVLRGAVPVFVDVRSDTLNIDEGLIESAITEKTRAIVPVHYAGVACEMDEIMKLAEKYELRVVEDAAQAVLSYYKGKALGGIGDLGAYSFHETKNIISGEGGGLLVNNPVFRERAEIIREKGTDRGKFIRGEVDKYTWVEQGSSYLPGEIIAAFLYAQTEQAEAIVTNRRALWNSYHQALAELENSGILRRPVIPAACEHSAHMYYILLNSKRDRDSLLDNLKQKSIQAVFHYIPLHNSPAGKVYTRTASSMSNTETAAERILRLPLYMELENEGIEFVVEAIREWARAPG